MQFSIFAVLSLLFSFTLAFSIPSFGNPESHSSGGQGQSFNSPSEGQSNEHSSPFEGNSAAAGHFPSSSNFVSTSSFNGKGNSNSAATWGKTSEITSSHTTPTTKTPYVAVAINGASGSSHCGAASTISEKGISHVVESMQTCANICVSSESCKSFSYHGESTTCTTYAKHANTLAKRSAKTASTKVYDRSCYHRTNPTPTRPIMTMGANVLAARSRANAHVEDYVVEALSGL